MSQHYAKGLKAPKTSEIQQTKDQYGEQDVDKSKITLGIVNELKEKLEKINALHDGLDAGASVLNEKKLTDISKTTKNCACANKQLRARKAGKLLTYKPLKTQEEDTKQFQKHQRVPVTFAILPEDLKKSADPGLKMFFGHDESLTLKPDVLTVPNDNDILMLHQLIDESQSVIEIVENVHDTAEKLLLDTEKALEKLELNKEASETLHLINRHEINPPLTTKMNEAVFEFAQEIEIRELEEKAKLDALDKPKPMVEVLDDSMDEINKVLFDSTLQSEFFVSPTLPKINENMIFEFSPETGALTFEKRSSSLMEEEDGQTERIKIQEKKVEDSAKIQQQSSKLRRAEAAEDLSLLGIITDKTCGCGMLRSKVQSPFACVSVDVSTAKFIDEKLKEADKKKKENKYAAENYQNFDEIQKKDPVENKEKENDDFNNNEKGGIKDSKTKASKFSAVAPTSTPNSLGTYAEKMKVQKEDDDDGYLNVVKLVWTNTCVFFNFCYP